MLNSAGMVHNRCDGIGQHQVPEITGIGSHTDITESQTLNDGLHLLLGDALLLQYSGCLDLHESEQEQTQTDDKKQGG